MAKETNTSTMETCIKASMLMVFHKVMVNIFGEIKAITKAISNKASEMVTEFGA